MHENIFITLKCELLADLSLSIKREIMFNWGHLYHLWLCISIRGGSTGRVDCTRELQFLLVL